MINIQTESFLIYSKSLIKQEKGKKKKKKKEEDIKFNAKVL
jgi:hypothetical protein